MEKDTKIWMGADGETFVINWFSPTDEWFIWFDHGIAGMKPMTESDAKKFVAKLVSQNGIAE